MAQRIAIGVALVLAIGLSWRAAPPIWHRIQLVYWQGRCFDYTAPADQVVFSNPKQISVIPREWSNFYNLRSPPGMNSLGTVFLHERTTSDGRRRWLVAVDVIVMNQGIGPTLTLLTSTTEPLSLRNEGGQQRGEWGGRWELKNDAVIYAGQPDDKDRSHFTIHLTTSGKDELLDGWLLSDGRIKLEPRPNSKYSGASTLDSH
jgi:hypothetical protein